MLRKEKFQANSSSHNGVALNISQYISEVPPSLNNGNNLKLKTKIYDFSGKSEYLEINNFFLNNIGTYLIVFDASNELKLLSDILIWLKALFSLINIYPSPNVILVGTHSESISENSINSISEIVSKQKRQFAFIKGVHFVSCTKEKGIKELKHSIFSNYLPSPLVPAPFELLYKRLEAIRQNYNQCLLSLIQFKQLMKESSITEDLFSKAIQFFNEIGEIIYYPDDPNLSDSVIIDTPFLANKMSDILKMANVMSNNNGIILKEQIDNEWKEISSENRNTLFELFSKIEFIYQNENKFIVPSLLNNVKPPTLSIFPLQAREYIIQLLPVGFFSRLISRLIILKDKLEFSTVIPWKNGIYLSSTNGEQAIISSFINSDCDVELTIVSGNSYYYQDSPSNSSLDPLSDPSSVSSSVALPSFSFDSKEEYIKKRNSGFGFTLDMLENNNPKRSSLNEMRSPSKTTQENDPLFHSKKKTQKSKIIKLKRSKWLNPLNILKKKEMDSESESEEISENKELSEENEENEEISYDIAINLSAKFIQKISNEVEFLMKNFYSNSNSKSSIICSKCISDLNQYSSAWSFEEVVKSFTSGKTELNCPVKNHTIPICSIAPDITFSYLPLLENVQKGKVLGKGG